MTIAAKSFVSAVNHLLAREPWARGQLAPYAGKSARLASPPWVVTLRVGADGMLEAWAPPADAPATPVDVTITVPGSALGAFAQGGQAGVMKHVRIDGDAEFAATLAKLAEHLRWEPEEDLARVIGDAGAHRLGTLARKAGAHARQSGRGLLESIAEYLVDENPQLVHRVALDDFSAELARARDALARLEKRLERLEGRVARPPRRSGTTPPPGGAR